MRPLLPIEECRRRLELIFPRDALDPVMSSPIAATAVAAMLYIDAVVADGETADESTWARPSTVLWLSAEAYGRGDTASRVAWRTAAARGKKAIQTLVKSWNEEFIPFYADNSRETIRDETFPRWINDGALRRRPGVATNSSAPRYALAAPFADLFEPSLNEDALVAAIDGWRDTHMSPAGRLKALAAQRLAESQHAVPVTLPDGTIRSLEPGETSVILKGVIEGWAPGRLRQPIVLSISEPGAKILTADDQMLQRLGINIDQTLLLPDALIADTSTSPIEFWVIEVVATDGPIDEDRKCRLLKWAAEQRIDPDACRFLTAFSSRNSDAARKRLKDIAEGTYAWYLDEPFHELAWYGVDAPDA